MKIKHTALALIAVAGLAGCATGGDRTMQQTGADPAVQLQDVNPTGLREMSAAEIRANLVHGTFVRDGKRTLAARVHPDHELSAKAFGGDTGLTTGQGRWTIKNGNDFCTNWDGAFASTGLTCFKAYRSGKQVVFATPDGRGMSVTLVGGNPYAL
ncbi:hypothetical protein CKO28_21990 [Rhodovibrio sodomensis]|uniref:Lipoprotein n=1 Tax=Rhodovibrio sodomensis TaxID=1088 RepID=A0ABS1DJN1_9PROT|nr:hypothetical protein [Rhodovibrio sodomensis]MBK1670695.1 hypothetical protein [Rhodovibrio sodomensis]